MKKLLFVCLLLAGIVVQLNGQTNSVINDSSENKSINVYNPNSFSEQGVTISDTTHAPAISSITQVSSSSGYRGTERIRYYSGNHEGTNVIRTVEVSLPDKK